MDTSLPHLTQKRTEKKRKNKGSNTFTDKVDAQNKADYPSPVLTPHNYTNFRAFRMTHFFTKEWLELIQNISIRNSFFST
jgi:hypothetical protein